MAESPWTCERCGAGNDPAALTCGFCAAAAPSAGRARSRALWLLGTFMLAALAAVGVTLLLAGRHQKTAAPQPGSFPSYTTPVLPPTTTPAAAPPEAAVPSTSQSPAGPACPADTARYLPGGSGTALLVAQTERFLVTVCQAGDGRIFYNGQARGQQTSSASHIFLPAQRSGDGFVAVNGEFHYTIGGGRLTVTQGAKVLSDGALTPVG